MYKKTWYKIFKNGKFYEFKCYRSMIFNHMGENRRKENFGFFYKLLSP